MNLPIDPRVLALIEAGGPTPVEPRVGEVFRTDDGEVQQVARVVDDRIVLEVISRGVSKGPCLVASDLRVLEVYLALDAAVGWRLAHGLDVLTDDRLPAPTEYSIVETAPYERAVLDAQGAVTASALSVSDAAGLAVALAHPLEVVVAAVEDPSGAPIWSGRRWRT